MAYVGTPIDTQNQFQSLVGKRFSGDASTTAFTLDVAPSSTLDIEVFVENVRQDPNSAYSLSGTTLTFAAAPPSGTNNIYVVHQAKAVGTISPAAGTVNADSFDNTVISGHTALAATPADTDEFLVSDAGTIKRIDFSHIKGQGKIKQVVEDSEFSTTQTSSTSFVDVGVACNITPSSTSSTILIHAGVGEPDELDGRIRTHVFRDSTDLGASSNSYKGIISAELGRNLGHSGTEDHFATFSKTFIDSPATTSQVTYSVKIASGNGSSIRIGNGSPSYVVAMEILA